MGEKWCVCVHVCACTQINANTCISNLTSKEDSRYMYYQSWFIFLKAKESKVKLITAGGDNTIHFEQLTSKMLPITHLFMWREISYKRGSINRK